MTQRIATRLHYGQRVPAYFGAKTRTRQSVIEQDPNSVIGRIRALQAEARTPVDLSDDPQNRTGLAGAQPGIRLGVALTGMFLVILFVWLSQLFAASQAQPLRPDAQPIAGVEAAGGGGVR